MSADEAVRAKPAKATEGLSHAMSKPLVSIIITCYNRKQRLPETLQSVFDQQYSPVEILVVDDGSTDGTDELMRSYAGRVRYHRQENQGIAKARTAGGQLAQGEWIAFQDDDDLMPPDRIVRLMAALDQHPDAAFAVGDFEIIDGASQRTGERSVPEFDVHGEEPRRIEDGFSAVLWPKISPVPHTTLFRRADGERLGWFDTRFFHACEDTDFFARCAKLGPIVYVPAVVSLYRREGERSLTADPLPLTCSRYLLLEKHLREANGISPQLRERMEHRMRMALRQMAREEAKGAAIPRAIPADWLTRGVGVLNWKSRIGFWLFRHLGLPVRLRLKRLVSRD